MNYRCLVGVVGGTQTSCEQPRNPGYMPGYIPTYLAEVIYGKNCLRFSFRTSGVKEPLLLFHRVHFLTFVNFRCMKRWFSVSVYFFMLVVLSQFQEPHQLYYVNDLEEELFSLNEVWCACMEVSAGKGHKRYAFLHWWSDLARYMFLSLPCLHCRIGHILVYFVHPAHTCMFLV